jgi:RimJ/RimL family protein N-acetyltransferase
MKQIKLKNGDTAIIREAIKSDAKALVDYVNTISGETDFMTFGPGEFGMSIEQEESYLNNASIQRNAIYLIVEAGGRIIGSLNFSGGARPRVAHTGEFGVSVLEEYWGNGIGTELIKYLIKWSKESGVVRKLNLRVRTDNSKAIRLYKQLGFVEEGVKTREFQIKGKFYDSMLMGLAID